ncbi:MAG: PaaI family thioesterase [Candidatus Rifleibacteriota bacterium]
MSMRLKFRPDGPNAVKALFQSHLHLQGYDGIMHGGVISALLDSAMTNCLFQLGIKAVTGELSVKFHHPVPCGAGVEITAIMEKAADPLFIMAAELRTGGEKMASAHAKFMRIAR